MQSVTYNKASLTVSQDTMVVAQNLNGGGAVYLKVCSSKPFLNVQRPKLNAKLRHHVSQVFLEAFVHISHLDITRSLCTTHVCHTDFKSQTVH